ncbi:MAG: helicase HerA domain-containing protein [Haloarculaceae archaeon]
MADGEDKRTIGVGEISTGYEEGTRVSLPVVELLTGRGFATGKSGSGKSNTASVVAEKLLDQGYGLLIVDTDGEYYGLKEEYEMLHVGADEECDFQVSAEHAGKIAELALEENVPIILDVSSFLDESEAQDLLTATARQLFAKEKKLKQPFLMIVEEVHEYIPEGGGMDECGRMLIKIGKRGRKHGLGILGISQRPADVKKDFITQCDWLVWHRLTWNNDTKVVGRILGGGYEENVEDLDDGEAFVMTDWSEEIRRVQFDRKETFDAGATPGLDDFERPDLKSVSGDLVSDLEQISEEQERRENRIADLRNELEKREKKIEELKAELKDARDLSEMADQFAHAMMVQAGARARRSADEQTTLPAYGDGADAEYDADRLASALSANDPPWTETAQADGGSAAMTGDETLDAIAHAVDGDHDDEPTVAEVAAGDSDGAASLDDDIDTIETGTATDAEPSDDAGDGDAADSERPIVRELREAIRGLDPVARGMLRHYRTEGPATPLDAHVEAGGDGNRGIAYDRNRRLREAGLVRHVGRGMYAYAVARGAQERHDGRLDDEELRRVVRKIEEAL